MSEGLSVVQDKTIDNALLALRRQIIRGNGEGLEHVETLLQMRDVHMPRVMPVRRADAARQGHIRFLILGALRDGPKPLREIVAHVAAHRPDAAPRRVSNRVSNVLWKMKLAGLVRREGRVWICTFVHLNAHHLE